MTTAAGNYANLFLNAHSRNSYRLSDCFRFRPSKANRTQSGVGAQEAAHRYFQPVHVGTSGDRSSTFGPAGLSGCVRHASPSTVTWREPPRPLAPSAHAPWTHRSLL